MPGNLQPLAQNFQIVRPDGTPTEYFIRWAQQKQIDIENSITEEQAQQLINAWAAQRQIIAGVALSGGGTLAADVTIDHEDSPVTPDIYGSSTMVPVIEIDQQGHVIAASEVPVSGGGGGSVTPPDLTFFSISVGSNKTVVGATGGVYIITTANGSGIQAQMTADSAPMTFILGMQGNAQADFNSFGLAIRDSAGKFVTLGRLSTTSVELGQWSNSTTFVSSTYSAAWQKPPAYFRAVVDASNDIQFAVSESKNGPWFNVGPLNTFLATIDAVGFYCNRNNASINPIAWFLDYSLT